VAEKKTRANGRASRELILSTALEVFAERGHRGTSLTEIATRVGMTQPGLLHHFPTKDHLLLEVVQQRESETEQDFQRLVEVGGFNLENAVGALAAINEGAPVQQLLLTTLSAESIPVDHPLHEHFVTRYRRLRTALAATLADGQVDGHIRDDIDAKAVAREVIAALDGLHLQWLLDPDDVSLSEVLSAYAKRVSADLAPPRRKRR
jgi:AcrR family transcriptional regulator